MKKNIINTCLLVISIFTFVFWWPLDAGFKKNQLKNVRVKKAYDQKWSNLQKQLEKKKINSNDFDVYFRVFKYEKEFEIWVKNATEIKYVLFKTLPICASSGDLGPKRKQGDYQVPEGFYQIESFNPFSNYHLALKVNYPNKSDLLKKTSKDAGGDIMIHGNCVTIGCIPLEDGPIEEVYILAVEAKNKNRNTNITIYPCKFTDINNQMLEKNYDSEKNTFWQSLKKTYDYFNRTNTLPKISIANNGDYIINEK